MLLNVFNVYAPIKSIGEKNLRDINKSKKGGKVSLLLTWENP